MKKLWCSAVIIAAMTVGTAFAAAPSAPTLSLPINTAVNVSTSPTLKWGTVSTATKYWVEISTSSSFTVLAVNDSTSTTGSATESGLSNGTTYYWRVAATNGTWSTWPTAWSFYTAETYPSGWSGAQNIYFNTRGGGAGVAATQYKFPVLVRLTSADISGMTGVQANGSDIRFTNANNLYLPFQIDTFNASYGAAIWVLADSVTGNADNQHITMLWGNPNGVPGISRGFTVFDTTTATAVNGQTTGAFVGVWHLGDVGSTTAGGYKDATYNGINGTGVSMTAASDTIGVIGVAQSFNGSTQSISMGNGTTKISGNVNRTIEGWAKGNNTQTWTTVFGFSPKNGGQENFFDVEAQGSSPPLYTVQIYGGSLAYGDFPTAANTNDLAWHYLAGSWDGTTLRAYLDGAPSDSNTSGSPYTEALTLATMDSFRIAYRAGSGNRFKGDIEEVRLSKSVRSASWIKLSYKNQQANDALTYRTAPTSVTYRSSSLNLPGGIAMTPDTPYAVSGTVTGYSVNPSLPSGLSLDPSLGIISGTPLQEQSATPYTVTASNQAGSVTTGVSIQVQAVAPALFFPGNTAVNVPLTPTLSWTNEGTGVIYWLQVSTDNTFTNITNENSQTLTAGSFSGPYSTGLSNAATYYWRVNASGNGGSTWAGWSAVWSFYTAENYASGWAGSMKIALNTRGLTVGGGNTGANLGTTQYKFPVLVRLTSSDLSNMASTAAPQANGSDIRFVNSYGNYLPFEIDTFYYASGNSGCYGAFWVLADSVQGNSANQYITMLWGNSSGVPSMSIGPTVFDTTNGSVNGQVTGNFVGVWHLNNAAFKSSTVNSYTTVGSTASYADTTGEIGHGRKFEVPNKDTIRVAGLMGSPSTTTISCWAKVDSINGNTTGSELVSVGDCNALRVWDNSGGTRDSVHQFYHYNGGWNNTYYTTTGVKNLHQGWKHFAAVCNPASSSESFYINGVAQGIASGGTFATAIYYSGDGSNTYFGENGSGTAQNYYFGGVLDEVRIEKTARSANWELLSYQNQRPGDSLTYKTAPVSVAFRSSSPGLLYQTQMTPDTPITVTGVVTGYSVSPSLPPGLSLDPVHGIISGTPSQVQSATPYTVTASNPIGSVTTSITILISGTAPTPFLPVNTAVEVPVTPTLSWSSLAGVTKYWVEISTSSSFSPLAVSDSTPVTNSATESGLLPGTAYYWRVANNGGGAWGPWSSPTWSFYTTENYTTTGWPGSKVIGFNTRAAAAGSGPGANVAATQYRFPVLVRLSAGDIAGMPGVQNNGSDIRFTNANGVHLPFQIDTFNVSTGAAIWVLADSVQGNFAGQYITMLWGNSSGVPAISRGFTVFDTTSGIAVNGQTTGAFAGVWHLNDVGNTNAGGYKDATYNGINGTGFAMSAASDTIGVSGVAQSFNGSSQYITMGTTGISGNASRTIEGWVKGNYNSSTWSLVFGFAPPGNTTSGDYFDFETQNSSPSLYTLHLYGNDYATTENSNDLKWDYLASTWDGAKIRVYLNGVQNDSTSTAPTVATVDAFRIGYSWSSASYFKGDIEEVRLSKSVRGPSWIKLCYENQQALDSLTYKTAPAALSYSIPSKLPANVAITPYSPTVTGVVSQYSVSPALPAGLTFNSTAGTISGTPSAACAAATYTVTAQNAVGSTSAGLSIAIVAPPSGLAYATNPATYLLNAPIANDSVSVTNPVDSFSVSGALPAGLSLNKTTGTITGTPTASQSATAYTITAKNIAGTATIALTITVIAAMPPSALSYSTPSASYWQNVAIIADTATLAAGIADSFTASPALPSGLSLNKTTGAISGTPGATQASSAYTVTAKNAAGVATASITILVYGPPSALAYALNPAVFWLGVAIATDSATLTGVADSFSVSPALPSGLSLNTATGSITGTPGATQAASPYAVSAWNPAGSASVSLPIAINGPPSVPVLALPVDNANTVASTPRLSWNTAAPALSYHVQLSTSASFTPLVADSSLVGASDSIVAKLPGGVRYYWRVAATNPAGSSAWATDSFTVMVYIAVPVRAGWNFVSLNVHAQDSLAADVVGTLKGFILAKTLTQVYWPYYGIDGIDTLAVVRGYQMFCDSVDTIKAAGPAVNVSATPIPLYGGWNLISYLPQAPMSVDSALAAVDSQVVLVKNQDGYVYWPAEELDGIGNMVSGQGYQMYMSISTVLTYPAGAGHARRFAGVVRKSAALPRPKHFACALNTGSSATVLSKRTTINGATARDSCEIGVYDSKGNLVGSGVVVHGATAFSVWGKSGLKKGTAAGCDASEKLTFKLWDGAQEYPLEFHGTMQPQYADNAILSGTLVVPSNLFISKFALSKAYPNPFRENIRIFFDVPSVAGKELQGVEINVFDLNGSMVRQLANGKYAAGHYSVSWDVSGQAALSSNMYIVEMKASQFNQRMKLFRVK